MYIFLCDVVFVTVHSVLLWSYFLCYLAYLSTLKYAYIYEYIHAYSVSQKNPP